MRFCDSLMRCIDLMPRVSQRLGIDWSRRIDQDPYGSAQYRAALVQCAQCPHHGACRNWLNRTHQAQEAPAFCQNKSRLDQMVRSDQQAADELT